MSTIDVREALWGLADTTQVRIIRKTVSGFLVSEEEDAKGGKWVEAVLQPLDPQQLLVKPEGSAKTELGERVRGNGLMMPAAWLVDLLDNLNHSLRSFIVS